MMAENWMSPQEAIAFLGIGSLEHLEQLVVEHGADFDADTSGELTMVDADDLREVLFDRHKEQQGHRPDDPVMHAKAREREKRNRAARAKARQDRKMRLVRRLKAKGIIAK